MDVTWDSRMGEKEFNEGMNDVQIPLLSYGVGLPSQSVPGAIAAGRQVKWDCASERRVLVLDVKTTPPHPRRNWQRGR